MAAPVAVATTEWHTEWHDYASSEQDDGEDQMDEKSGVPHDVPPWLMVRRGCGTALHRVWCGAAST
jgi:hypothetical protein